MPETSTDPNISVIQNGKALVARKFLSGLPTALIYALLALVAGFLAATAGFLPPVINAQGTAALIGGVVFLAELISFL